MTQTKHPQHPKHGAKHPRSKYINIALGVMVGLVMAGGLVAWEGNKGETRALAMRDKAMHEVAAPASETHHPGGAFTLTDLNGKTVTDQDYRGKYLLVNFGYTFCPDMCPTGLQSIAHALKSLGDKADRVQPLFISIDPARDTPAKLKEYVNSFSPRIMALRGNDAQTAEVAKAYQVYYTKKESEDGADQYEIDHSTLIYLMGTDGAFISSFNDDVDPVTLTAALRKAWGDAELPLDQKPASDGK